MRLTIEQVKVWDMTQIDSNADQGHLCLGFIPRFIWKDLELQYVRIHWLDKEDTDENVRKDRVGRRLKPRLLWPLNRFDDAEY